MSIFEFAAWIDRDLSLGGFALMAQACQRGLPPSNDLSHIGSTYRSQGRFPPRQGNPACTAKSWPRREIPSAPASRPCASSRSARAHPRVPPEHPRVSPTWPSLRPRPVPRPSDPALHHRGRKPPLARGVAVHDPETTRQIMLIRTVGNAGRRLGLTAAGRASRAGLGRVRGVKPASFGRRGLNSLKS